MCTYYTLRGYFQKLSKIQLALCGGNQCNANFQVERMSASLQQFISTVITTVTMALLDVEPACCISLLTLLKVHVIDFSGNRKLL